MATEKDRARWRRWAAKNGRIGKHLTLEEKFHSRYEIVPESGCWLWTGNIVGNRPYGRIKVGEKNIPAHRFSWELHNGKIPAGLFALHRCDVTCCVNPAHLFIGTHIDNMNDMDKKGRRGSYDGRGEKHSRVKLNNEKIKIIRESKLSDAKLSVIFGIGRASIYKIKKRMSWAHVI